MFSFYGGQPGESFKISKIFPNKVKLDEDLGKKWASEVMPGEYVLISYGGHIKDITDAEGNITEKNGYNKNLEIDYNTYGNSVNYNATLWKKTYYEPALENNKDTIIAKENSVQNFGQEFFTPNIITKQVGSITQEFRPDSEFYNSYNMGIENRTYSENSGLCYELITILTGNTPQLEIIQDYNKVIGPLEDPKVSINVADINKPQLTFELPRAVRFYHGTEVNLSDKDYDEISGLPINNSIVEITEFMQAVDIMVGDYYINENNSYVFLLKEINQLEDGTVKKIFVYQGNFQPSKGINKNVIIAPYKRNEAGEFVSNSPKTSIEKIKDQWIVTTESLKTPSFKGEVEFVGPEDETNKIILGEITSEEEFTYKFNIPRGSKIFSGIEVEGKEYSSTVIEGAKLGDIYLNTNQDSESLGNIYKLENNIIKNTIEWKNYGSIKGPMGEGIKIKGSYVVDKDTIIPTPAQETIGEDSLERVSKYLEAKNIDLRADEIVAVTYRSLIGHSPEDQAVQKAIQIHNQNKQAHNLRNWVSSKEEQSVTYKVAKAIPSTQTVQEQEIVNKEPNLKTQESFTYDTSYWYFQIYNEAEQKKVWNRICITSGLYGIIQNKRVEDFDEGKIYSTKYINSLVGQGEDDPDYTTYNKTTIENKINNLAPYWKTF